MLASDSQNLQSAAVRVLLAASDPAFTPAARLALRSESVAVEIAPEAREVLDRVMAVPYDALVLDLCLPGAHGVELLKRLRRNRVAAPILALTADENPGARIEALRFGADDCLVKPVLMAELVARVHALARRVARKTGDVLEIEDLVLHCDRRRAFRAGQALPLTEREFTALEQLIRARGHPVPAATLLGVLWNEETSPKDNFIAVLMMRLRKKVDDGAAVKLIQTIRGAGYAVMAPGA